MTRVMHIHEFAFAFFYFSTKHNKRNALLKISVTTKFRDIRNWEKWIPRSPFSFENCAPNGCARRSNFNARENFVIILIVMNRLLQFEKKFIYVKFFVWYDR